MLSGKARKMRKPSLSWSNLIHTITLWIQTVFQNLHVFNFPIQYPKRCKILVQFLMPFKIFCSKTMLSENARKMQKPSFSRSKVIHNVTLWIQTVFQNSHVFNFLIQYPKRCKFLVQILMPCKFFAPKPCFPKRHGKFRSRRFLGVTWFILWFCEFNFFSKSHTFWKFLNQHLRRCKVWVQILTHCSF